MKYLYIEDSPEKLSRDIIDLLELHGKGLKVIFTKPLPFKRAMAEIPKEEYDGLLLDLRLDEESEAEYRAFTLAQEIRTITTEKNSKWIDTPIVICSTDPKLKKSYNRNFTGQDLFDKKYRKEEDIVNNPEQTAKELVALATGYSQIRKLILRRRSIKLFEFFGLTKEQLGFIDERLKFFSFASDNVLPAHEYARFILGELIEKPGELIDRETLLTRLGLDEKSPGVEYLLKRVFNKHRYEGPFHDGFDRWWWPLINQWWFNDMKQSIGLVNLDAKARTEIIRKRYKVELLAAEPIIKNYGTRYWTICRALEKPLDLKDAVLVDLGYEPFPWQNKGYVSISAVFNGKAKQKGINIHPSEQYRIDQLKQTAK